MCVVFHAHACRIEALVSVFSTGRAGPSPNAASAEDIHLLRLGLHNGSENSFR
jgi:hypothetical protein